MRLPALLTCALAGLFSAAIAQPPDAAKPFLHPGVLLNRAQLDLIKQRVTSGVEPQAAAFAAMLKSPYAVPDYAPKPRATVECGSFSRPDFGCKDERGVDQHWRLQQRPRAL